MGAVWLGNGILTLHVQPLEIVPLVKRYEVYLEQDKATGSSYEHTDAVCKDLFYG